MGLRGRIIVLDENESTRTVVCAALDSAGYEAIGVATTLGLKKALAPNRPTVVLFDVSPPHTPKEAIAAIEAARSMIEGRARLVISGSQSAEVLSEIARECRASGFVERRQDPIVLLRGIQRLLATGRTPVAAEYLHSIGAPPSSPQWTILKLLLVDDSEITLTLMQHRLRASGFDVRIALSLGEVRSIIDGWSPNVIVADVNMPDMRGDDLCARLKAAAATREALVMLCSSMPERDLADVARAAGADGFVSKNNGLDHAVNAIEAQCRKLSNPLVSFD